MTETLERMAGLPLLDETIAILRAARPRSPEVRETIELHLGILQARRRAAAELRPAGAMDGWVTDWNAFARLFGQICATGAEHRPALTGIFRQLAQKDTGHLQEAADAFLRDQLDERVTAWPDLLGFVLNNTLHLFIQASAAFSEWPLRAAEEGWYRRKCPVCGGKPDFAALEKESGARRLLCARCDTEWTFYRTGCPFCGEERPEQLGYYPWGDRTCRLYVCDNCKRYLKTMDLRELARPVNLPAERILSVGMDVAALDAGYLPD